MKIIKILTGIILVLLLFSCEKEDDDYKSTGTIVGYDISMCICCGGWIIIIDDTNYLFDNLPDNSDINLETEQLPISVKLDWQVMPDGCPPNRITIQRIKKI
jgi:hypothetical protein